MQCYNCGDDADMEVLMMINGKMKKINICMECYKEQMQAMMESMQDENGDINPDEIQKKMFNFFRENKEEFNKFLGEAIGDENFDIDSLNPENFDISSMNFDNSGFNLNNENVNDLFEKIRQFGVKNPHNHQNERKTNFGFGDFKRETSKVTENTNSFNLSDEENRNIKNLESAARLKRNELNASVQNEDYLTAATLRDEVREINKKIMIIKRLSKEVSKEGENI